MQSGKKAATKSQVPVVPQKISKNSETVKESSAIQKQVANPQQAVLNQNQVNVRKSGKSAPQYDKKSSLVVEKNPSNSKPITQSPTDKIEEKNTWSIKNMVSSGLEKLKNQFIPKSEEQETEEEYPEQIQEEEEEFYQPKVQKKSKSKSNNPPAKKIMEPVKMETEKKRLQESDQYIQKQPVKQEYFKSEKNNKNLFIPVNQPTGQSTTTDNDQTVLNDTMKNLVLDLKKNSSCDPNYKPSEQYYQLVDQIQAKAIKLIPFEEINNENTILGEGGFGQVFKGKWQYLDVAIKEMYLSYQEFKTMEQEMTFLAKERHPNIVGMYGVSVYEIRQNKLHCAILMELMLTDLETFVFSNQNKVELKKKIKFLMDSAQGIAFLHSQGIVHRDIKPQNILIDQNYVAKVSDLGIARVLKNKEQTQGCTIAFTAKYASKEAAVDEMTSYASDIWSFGLMTYEIISEKRVWPGLSPNRIIIQLSKNADPFQGQLEENIQDKNLIDLIKTMNTYSPEERPNAKSVYLSLKAIYEKL